MRNYRNHSFVYVITAILFLFWVYGFFGPVPNFVSWYTDVSIVFKIVFWMGWFYVTGLFFSDEF